ncbi:MAG TPA: dethiobiotin synthase [Rhodocyclaceae bacterium]|nr:dethiobiotin synthase [Rhodocyclaceae bacterium]
MNACFVAGTDTGVGKTLASAALLHAWRRAGRTAVGMKPVAAGAVHTDGGWQNEDALSLRAVSSVAVPPELDNPVLLREPLSPHLAARHEGVEIDIGEIARRFGLLAQRADAVVVEGAGGFLVPLGEHATGADLARALRLPVVLVVGMRLGCLNHALLSAQAIRGAGLPLAGWIANRIDPQMAAVDENIAYLQQRLEATLLAEIAHGQTDPAAIAVELPLSRG